MKIVTNVFGPDVRLKEGISLGMESATLRDVLRALIGKGEGGLKRIIKDDLSLEEGYVILVNGRNSRSLEGLETRVHDGDEITLTVLVSGG